MEFIQMIRTSYDFTDNNNPTSPLDASLNTRTYCVSVRFNEEELKIVNSKRGEINKGKWLRLLALEKNTLVIPTINLNAWKSLTIIVQNLNRIALHIDSKSKDSELTHTELFAVKRQLKELRQHLLNADIWSKPDEGYAEDQER
ncbi:hypothetical protein M2T59_18290 [Klebsiella pneumoniae]|uniref:hypothetical protein n=2 Tax=Enterobacteriaceae TaxID=543 RepID=UPI002010BC02|nr:hypothetical protein [Klebsiella pneumoniae]MCL0182201.1 hypothetical protein [Klebsiella pneumoniae]MCL0189789.1 hypothetical protein [Klebsiella pneumoniae]MCL0259770.1 hypothetical protein [Klebsiella pneumoniae]